LDRPAQYGVASLAEELTIMKTQLSFLLTLTAIVLVSGCSQKPTDAPDGSLEGTATLEGQEDHGGIIIQLRELGREAITRADGHYSFSSVPAGTHSILATDSDTVRKMFDFTILNDITVSQGRKTVAPDIELPLFHRIESDLSGQVRWTAVNGPYLITRSTTVLLGAHLTIEPGTTIKFAGYHGLTVSGDMVAKGTATDSIRFTTANVEGASRDWDRITLDGSGKDSPDTILYCHIQYANIGLDCQQGSPFISRISISHCYGYGIVSSASTPEISESALRQNYGGISCENGSEGIIEANIIQENAFAGINCANASSPKINDMILSHNQYGLFALSGCNPLVWHNLFLSNEYGIYLQYGCSPLIEANEISENQLYGLFLEGHHNDPQIHLNNIYQNGISLLHNHQPDDVQAQNNWWGTESLNEINALIWDVHDNAGLGEVLYDPILFAPVDSAGPRVIY
jgi:hypothetical protein